MTLKVTMTFMFALTYFMTSKVKGHDPKSHGNLCGQFDIVNYPKRSQGR